MGPEYRQLLLLIVQKENLQSKILGINGFSGAEIVIENS